MSELFEAAKQAQKNAYAPYSKFAVGAALKTPNGRLFAGCNVENVAYPEGCCAEAGAISAMVSAGFYEISEILIVGPGPETIAPCGGCRQKIAEFAKPETRIFLAGPEGVRVEETIAALLPGSFGKQHLEKK